MSAENKGMRRTLTINLVGADRKAGITNPIERERHPDILNFEFNSSALLYFSSFDQYLAWLGAQENKLQS